MNRQLVMVVFGRVQHVGFRFLISYTAKKMGLSGFCRNESDGSVRIVSQGTKEKLEQFAKTVSKGTFWISVDTVSLDWFDSFEPLNGFEIRH
ncbi:MAG: acylphosphatase [Candidatus Micrarchaeota archaeon]